MLNNNKRKSIIFSFIKFKKKYIKKLVNSIKILNCLKKQFYQSLHFFLSNNHLLKYKKDFLISYVVYFCFSVFDHQIMYQDV